MPALGRNKAKGLSEVTWKPPDLGRTWDCQCLLQKPKKDLAYFKFKVLIVLGQSELGCWRGGITSSLLLRTLRCPLAWRCHATLMPQPRSEPLPSSDWVVPPRGNCGNLLPSLDFQKPLPSFEAVRTSSSTHRRFPSPAHMIPQPSKGLSISCHCSWGICLGVCSVTLF